MIGIFFSIRYLIEGSLFYENLKTSLKKAKRMKTLKICTGVTSCITFDSAFEETASKASQLDIKCSESVSTIDTNIHNEGKSDEKKKTEKKREQAKKNMMSTPVFVHDNILVWRPAELLKKQYLLKQYDQEDPKFAHVSYINFPCMDYTLDYHKRVIAPTLYVSPYRSRTRLNSMELIANSGGANKNKNGFRRAISLKEDFPHESAGSLSDADSNSIYSVESRDDSVCTTSSYRIDQSLYENGILPMQDVDVDGRTILRDNLSDLPYLHEASILYNLAERNEKGIPYTRAGGIIIAINPFRWITGMYSKQKRELYADHLVWRPKRKNLTSIEPHVYEASSLAYRGLVIDGNNQSVIVSGETGAGKTETVKILMSHLATFGSKKVQIKEEESNIVENVIAKGKKSGFRYRPRFFQIMSSRKLNDQSGKISEPDLESDAESVLSNEISCVSDSSILDDQHKKEAKLCLIVEKVLDADVLLEAFGNAKTQKNDNSSRFSKYTRLQFYVEFMGHATPSCTLAGSICNTYLLQKSRVVTHNKDAGERSFHIFYQLLASSEETKKSIWEGLVGKTAGSFRYIGVPSIDMIEGLSDSDRWQETSQALDIFGMRGEKFKTLMRALCATLQLGNLVFDVDLSNEEGSIITNLEELKKCSDILGINEDKLSSAFTSRLVVAPDVTFTVPLTVGAAKDTCNAFAKSIYSMAFDWLVQNINLSTCAEDNYMEGTLSTYEYPTIALLDIFGFETFPQNLFEQMCINHANEKLQHKFIEDVFSSVEKEYKAEGISLSEINYEDNTEVLMLVEGNLGLIDILNEECFRPKGSDKGFVNKIYSNNRDKLSPLYKKRNFRDYEFGIKHFAGPVKYDATEFVAKNVDHIPPLVVECAVQSTNDIIQSGFSKVTTKKRSVKSDTVWKQFNTQFNNLLEEIKKTDTRYIRCIVPNKEKKPSKTDLKYTLDQLRCAGVMSAVTMSRAAFPNRMANSITFDRFSNLITRRELEEQKQVDENILEVEIVLDKVLKSMEKIGDDGTKKKAYTCGKSKVYFRSGALEYLEEQRLLGFEKNAVVIQCWFRYWLAQDHVKKLRNNPIGHIRSKSKYRPKSFLVKLKNMSSSRRLRGKIKSGKKL